jgi:hypothetical protein
MPARIWTEARVETPRPAMASFSASSSLAHVSFILVVTALSMLVI